MASGAVRQFAILISSRGLNMTTNSTSHLGRFAKGALLVSAAFPLSALIAAGANAAQTVEVNAPATKADDVNANIIAKIGTPDRDITITVTSKGEVISPTSPITLTPGAGQGDGKVVFGNAGSIGAVDKAGAVTDAVGVDLGGSGKADNTLTATNSGLITGGFSATGFGGTASLDNSGTIHNGVTLGGNGDLSLESTGAVRSGNVFVQSKLTKAVTKTGELFTSGDVTGVIADVVSADGKTKGDATFVAEFGNVDVTATGVAGNVVGYTLGSSVAVDTAGDPAVAGKATVTQNDSTTFTPGTTKIVTTSTSKLGGVFGFANGDVDISVAGSAGAVQAKAIDSGYNDSTVKVTETLDAGGGLLQSVTETSSTSIAGSATVTIADKAAVDGGGVLAEAVNDATVASAGAVKGDVNANAGRGFASTSSTTIVEDGALGRLQEVYIDTNEQSAGNASVDVASTGSVDGNVNASASNDASITNAGKVGGSLNVSAGSGIQTQTENHSYVYDGKGAQLGNVDHDTSASLLGSATVDVAATGSVDGSVSANATQDVTIANAGKIAGNVSGYSFGSTFTEDYSDLTPADVIDAKLGTTTHVVQDTSSTDTYEQYTGKVDFANAAGGVVGFNSVGSVNLEAGGDVTILNQGEVRGQTYAQSSSFKYVDSGSYKETEVTDAKLGLTTTVETKNAYSSESTGGNVTGTYAGANGTLNFPPAADGSIIQQANGASKATVTGSVFGNLSSNAGVNAYNVSSESAGTTTTIVDVDGNGGRTSDAAYEYTSGPVSGGDSTVVVSGRVGNGNAHPFRSAGNVDSFGTNSSSVAVSGIVEGNLTSASYGTKTGAEQGQSNWAQTISDKGVTTVTDSLTDQYSETYVASDGVASASITGNGTVGLLKDGFVTGGSVVVEGVTSATATVEAKATVLGNLSVDADNGNDSEYTAEQTYTRDAESGVATAKSETVSVNSSAAVQGNATATIAGTVGGDTDVEAGRGDATVTLTGVSVNGVYAGTGASVVETTSTSEWTGKSSSAATDFSSLKFSLAAPATVDTTTVETTVAGGKATILVDTAAALKNKGVAATLGDVRANGVGGASVTITEGTIVGDDLFDNVQAVSVDYNNLATDTNTNDGKGVQNLSGSSTTTIVGGDATVTNAGEIAGSAHAGSPTSATVSNTGRIGLDASASAIFLAADTAYETTNNGPASLMTTTETETPVVALGKASVTNAAGAVIGGDVYVQAGEGTVTNDGTIGGTTILGRNLDTATRIVVRTDTTTKESYTPAAELVSQVYVVNQNTVSGGVYIGGGLDNDQAGEGRVKSSDVQATINLNSGSATLGTIEGERDPLDGSPRTNTTVNLVGSGFLGADMVLYPNETADVTERRPNTILSLGKDAQEVFGYRSDFAVRVIGVKTLNKEGAGTFVINGEGYVPSTGPGDSPIYTLDVGNFNINAGEVQLTTDAPTFGVSGNINNAATLVLGRRIIPGQEVFGNSLVGQTELIDGIHIVQVGDYNQVAEGTTVVGITPSLLRVYNPYAGDNSSASELLGPVVGGVNRGYFTTPTLAGLEVDPSRVDITGNLDLAGTVAVNVYRDSIYANGDGYTLFTYTGDGAVSAAAAPTLTSPYVGFTLVHDRDAKEVRLEVKRNSYAGGATNPNAVAAAVGLDSALASAVSAIRTDAGGGAGFNSITQLGYAQDIANVATALDFRLSSDQAAQLFNELSSGEVYGSLAAVDQNGVFGQTLDMLTNRRSFGGDFATQLWLNPVGNWGKFGDGDAYGASDIRANSYGLAGGLDFAYAADGAFGFGGSYAEHDIAARGTPESVDGRTWTVGAYVTQGFGPIYANAKLAFGWTNYDATRTMSLLARTAEASINAKQLDASLEVGYDYRAGSVTVTPYGKLVLRRTSLEGFTETGAGAFSLDVDGRKKTVFSPVLGVKLGTETELSDNVTLRPFAKASYTFQGNLPNDVTVSYIGGGDKFVLRGAEPDSYGMVEAGFEAKVADRLNLFFTGSQTFGGDNKVTGLRGGVSFQF